MRKLLVSYVVPFLLIYLIGLAVLSAYKYTKGYADYVIPSPYLVVTAFRSWVYAYSLHSLRTISISLAGYTAAIVTSFAVASVVFFSGRFKQSIFSASSTIQAFPLVAVAPIFFIVFGENIFTFVFISALICYFPMLLALLGALLQPMEEVEHFYRSSSRLNGRATLFKIRILENLGALLTVLEGCVTLAVVGAVVAEFLSANEGVGFVIRTSSDANKLDQILVALFSIGLINALLLWLVDLAGGQLRRRLGGE